MKQEELKQELTRLERKRMLLLNIKDSARGLLTAINAYESEFKAVIDFDLYVQIWNIREKHIPNE